MGKCSNAFFSPYETTNIIKAKLYMNVHWMVPYKLYVFCSDMKFKMAATAGLSLTLDPMEKMFQNASSLKPLGQLKAKLYMNVHWMVLYKLYVFCSDMKFKMAATAGLNLTLDPMGKCSNAFFSETTIIKAKLYMNVHWTSRFLFRYEIQNGTAGLKSQTLFIDPMVKCSKRFFSETTWILLETKLPRNDHWKVFYKVCVFYVDRISKMATTAGHRLTLDP